MEVSTKLFNAQATKNFSKINEQIQDTQAKIASGKKEFSPVNEKKIHKDSFSKIKKQIKKRFPKLKVELNLISLDSKITKF